MMLEDKPTWVKLMAVCITCLVFVSAIVIIFK